ncbi:MAG TPA: phosphate ABC transporter permease subunit PstC [Trueperaceae bacterium]
MRLRAAARARERVFGGVLLALACLSVLTTVGVVAVLVFETTAFFSDPAVSLREFFTGRQWTPLFADQRFGILPLLTGTLMVTGIALIVGVPLGLMSAVYLSEFAAARRRRRVTSVLELLAGIPTVVLGYFALLFVTPLLQRFVPDLDLFNPLSAGLVMAFMILPTVSSISTDAMQAVPGALRQAAYGMGATKIQLIWRVVLPASLSGIVASVILAFSRAVGETMIVTLAAGQRPLFTLDPRETIATMTSFIVQAASGDQPAGSLAARSLYAVAATLFAITLVLNLVSQIVVRRFRERYE